MGNQRSGEPRKDARIGIATDGGPVAKIGSAPAPFEAALELWELELRRKGKGAEYIRRGPRTVRELFEHFGWSDVRQADTAPIAAWLGKQACSGQSQNNKLAMIRAFFRHCAKILKLRPDNPTSEIDAAESIKGEGVREFSPEEQGRIIAAAHGDWRIACTLFATTALRRGAVFQNIRVRYFDRERRQLQIPKGVLKNKKREQVIPLNDDAMAALEEACRGKGPDDCIVPCRFDKKTWYFLLKRAGVAHVDERGRVAGTHSFRKGAASTLAEHDVHLKVAKELLGHSDIRLTERVYTRVGNRKLAEAVKFLNVVTPYGTSTCTPMGADRPHGEKKSLDNGGVLVDADSATPDGPEPMILAPSQPRQNPRPGASVPNQVSQLDKAIGAPGRGFQRGSLVSAGFESPEGAKTETPPAATGGVASNDPTGIRTPWGHGLPHPGVQSAFAPRGTAEFWVGTDVLPLAAALVGAAGVAGVAQSVERAGGVKAPGEVAGSTPAPGAYGTPVQGNADGGAATEDTSRIRGELTGGAYDGGESAARSPSDHTKQLAIRAIAAIAGVVLTLSGVAALWLFWAQPDPPPAWTTDVSVLDP